MTRDEAPAANDPPRRAPRARRGARAALPAPPPDAPPVRIASRSSILPKALSAMDAVVSQADAAAQGPDIAATETFARVSERLLKVTNGLQIEPAPQKAEGKGEGADEALAEDAEAAGLGDLLERMDAALARERETHRLEVEQMLARGLDPRSGWFWNEEAGEWSWRPAQAMADDALARRRRRSGDPEEEEA